MKHVVCVCVCVCDRQNPDIPTALNDVSVENIRHSLVQSPRKYFIYNTGLLEMIVGV